MSSLLAYITYKSATVGTGDFFENKIKTFKALLTATG
jgi:hypothetical protein